MKITRLVLISFAAALPVFADPPEAAPCVYRLDPRPVAQTPKFLGADVEVMQAADRANIWDWLADSGAGMIRTPHPDTNLRRKDPAAYAVFQAIRTKADFEAFRTRLLADPAHDVPWTRYRFDEEVPWLGRLDGIMSKLRAVGIEPLLSIAYAPGWFERPLLATNEAADTVSDDAIDWGAAASAYEYAFACVWHFASRFAVTRYMMLNEPPNDATTIRQVGVLARIERLALEDARTKLADARTAKVLTLSGPATYLSGEAYWPHVEPYVNFFDVHLYEPDAAVFARKLSRALTCARPSGKRTMVTEFNRVGGPMTPEESLFSIRPSLQVAGLLCAVLGAAHPDDPGIEAALLYEFQFPATHRNYKSLVYGDMNQVDWTGRDRPLRKKDGAFAPSFEALQVRFATPAYAMFRMAARCVPGPCGTVGGYPVYELGEANLGVSAVRDPVARRNVYGALDPERYYADGGGGSRIRTLAVKAGERFIVLALNPEPVTVRNLGFDITPLGEAYATVVVRETSVLHRDEVIAQDPVTAGRMTLDLPPESLTQLLFVKADLSGVSALKLEETTVTPGDSRGLGLLETTRLRALGRMGDGAWLDLTDLNVTWSSSDPDAVRVGSCGLVQRMRAGGEPVTITARIPNGAEAVCRIPGGVIGKNEQGAAAEKEAK